MLKNLKKIRKYVPTVIIGLLLGFLMVSLMFSLNKSRGLNETMEIELTELSNEIKKAESEYDSEIILENEILISDLEIQIRDIKNELEVISAELEKYIDSVTTGIWERNIDFDYKYQEFLYRMCVKHGVGYDLMLGKISIESNFNVNAMNDNNPSGSIDVGVSQINSVHWNSMLDRGLDVQNNVFDNIEAGVMIYKRSQKYWSGLGYVGYELNVRSLNSYNFGISGYLKYMENGNSWDDWKYAKAVYSRMENIR